MSYSYFFAIGKPGQKLPPELTLAIRDAGFTIAHSTTINPPYTIEPPLHTMLSAGSQTRADLRAMGLSKLSQVSRQPFAKVWRGMSDKNCFGMLLELMRKLGMVFADYNPSNPSCENKQDWTDRGLTGRIANALLRESLDDIGMLRLLEREDFIGIRLVGEQGADMIEAVRNTDTSEEQ